MKPTTKLRFVERMNRWGEEKKILQQWWQHDGITLADLVGEWRDVPTEQEEEPR